MKIQLYDGKEYEEDLLKNEYPNLYEYALKNRFLEDSFAETNYLFLAGWIFFVLGFLCFFYVLSDGTIISAGLLVCSAMLLNLYLIPLVKKEKETIRIEDGFLYIIVPGLVYPIGSLTDINVKSIKILDLSKKFPYYLRTRTPCFYIPIKRKKGGLPIGTVPKMYKVFEEFFLLTGKIPN